MPTYQIETKRGRYRITAPTPEAAGQAIEAEMRALDQADQIERTGGEYGAADLFANQAMLGLADKAAGLAGGVGGLITGEGFGQGYETGRRAQEILENRARERSGRRGTAAEIIGAIGTGVLAKAPAAATAIGRALQTGREAGTLGALHGAGESEARDLPGFAGDVALGAGLGAGVGTGLGAAMEIGRAGIRGARAIGRGLGSVTDNPTGRAGRMVTEALDADDITAEQAIARMRHRDTALVNVGGDNVTGLARATSAQPGRGRNTMNRALDAQQRSSADRATRAVTDALGGADETFNRRVAARIAERSKVAQQRYGEAFSRNFDEGGHAMAFDELAQRVPSEALKNAMRIARAEGRPFGEQLVATVGDAGEVALRRAPSLREWHYIQRGLRAAKDAAYRSGVGEVGTAYKALHKDILEAMDEASPSYKMARKHYATESQQIEALQFGRQMLSPTGLRNVDTLADDLAAMSRPEREMARLGLARQMEDMIRNTPDAAGDVVKKVFGTPAKRSAIRTAFESDSAFRKFEVAMRRLSKEGQVFRDVRTGSRTSFVDSEKQSFGALGEAAAGMAHGSVTSTAIQAAARLIKDAGQMDERVAAEAARILVQRDPDLVRRALMPSANRAARRSALDEMLRKASIFSRTGSVGAGGSSVQLVPD